MATNPAFLSAIDLLKLYRRKSLSPVEVLEAVLRRLHIENPKLNAFCHIDEETGRKMAKASEARWMKGKPKGLVDGVPIPIKDTNAAKGWPFRYGSRTTSPEPADYDYPAVARLREHGAVFFGKTTTPEFGWKGVTDSPLTGITRNPWNPAKTSGGSSGGAVVAVATGIGPLALGGDGGGSIRMPSGYTGVYGIKATFGRVPNMPSQLLHNMSLPGPIGRHVADNALMLRVLSYPDHRDPYALPPEDIDYLALLKKGVKGLRIGFSPALGYAEVDRQVAAKVAEAVKVFERLGAHVELADPGFDNPRWALDILWRAGLARTLMTMTPEQMQLVEPELLACARSGMDVSAITYLAALNEKGRMGQAMEVFHQKYDLLVTPTLPIVAFDAGLLVPDRKKYPQWYDWSPFSWPFNMTRQPAASCPCGFNDQELPVGMQIVGPLHREDLVLRASYAFEEARPFKMPRG
ncbi:MAG: amidase [Proteobacteria bacterium]|nr:amidase [Pseudomonadota bacterium]MBI3498075.1 amidase [Pseudomonadota bacterium]